MAEGRSLYASGVRTEEAREDWAQYWRDYRRRPFKAAVHGLRSTYVNHACRCSECSLANRTYRMAKYPRRTPWPPLPRESTTVVCA